MGIDLLEQKTINKLSKEPSKVVELTSKELDDEFDKLDITQFA
jgi:hypothetical protein